MKIMTSADQPDGDHWTLAHAVAVINAEPSVIYRLLSDVGGWRIWNDTVEFSDTEDSLSQPLPLIGLFYLSRFPHVRWKMQVDTVIPDQEVTVTLRLAGMLKLQLKHQVKAVAQPEVAADKHQSIVIFEINLLGKMAQLKPLKIPRRVLRLLMRHYARDGLKGLKFAAEQVSLGQGLPR